MLITSTLKWTSIFFKTLPLHYIGGHGVWASAQSRQCSHESSLHDRALTCLCLMAQFTLFTQWFVKMYPIHTLMSRTESDYGSLNAVALRAWRSQESNSLALSAEIGFWWCLMIFCTKFGIVDSCINVWRYLLQTKM